MCCILYSTAVLRTSRLTGAAGRHPSSSKLNLSVHPRCRLVLLQQTYHLRFPQPEGVLNRLCVLIPSFNSLQSEPCLREKQGHRSFPPLASQVRTHSSSSLLLSSSALGKMSQIVTCSLKAWPAHHFFSLQL